MSEIITANRLSDGVVVFQNDEGGWDDDFNRAAILEAKDAAAAALTRARVDEGRNIVVDAYAVEVEARNGHYAPKALREAIRAAGPTTRRDLGKQALGLSPHAGPHARMEASHVSL